MSNDRILIEWLRDSFVGFLLFSFAIVFAGIVNDMVPFNFPSLSPLLFLIGLIPLCKFAVWRRAVSSRAFSRSQILAIAIFAMALGCIPRDLGMSAFVFVNGLVGMIAVHVVGLLGLKSQS